MRGIGTKIVVVAEQFHVFPQYEALSTRHNEPHLPVLRNNDPDCTSIRAAISKYRVVTSFQTLMHQSFFQLHLAARSRLRHITDPPHEPT